MSARCSVCRRKGHTSRLHSGITNEELTALKADGLDYMGRGFRELGEVHAGGDLLDQLRADTEAQVLAGEPVPMRVSGGGSVINDGGWLTPDVAAALDEQQEQQEKLHEAEGASSEGPNQDTPQVEPHQCEPAPDQVAYCRHCGADLMTVDSAGTDGRWFVEEEPDDLDVCTACLGETRFVPVLAGRAWHHVTEQLGDHDVQVRWDPATVGPLRLLTWRLPDQTVMYGHGEHGPQFAPWRTPLGPDGPKLITLPGVYELDAAEYHDPEVTGDWLSNSDARQLVLPGCPAQFRYDRDNRVRTTSEAFAVGHAVHARILGKGEEIAVRPAKWQDWRTNAAKAWRREQEAAGRSVILPEQAAFVEAMAEAVHLKPRAHELLSQPGRPEVGLFWVDPETGVQRRALVDYLPDAPGPDGIMEPVDIKSADSVAPDESMERKLYDHAWHRQGTTIADGIVALGLARDVEFYFVVQSKRAPHLVTVVKLDSEAERIGRIENRHALLVYQRCLNTGIWPDYADDPVTLGVPAWIARQYEDEIEVSR